MQKLITIAVPSYNSEAYLRQCVDSLLVGGEEVEIIIVNDGSTDKTASIADEYAQKYPTIVRAVHKPNGGHGSGVNKGLELATGLFYKVVDSDDHLEESAFRTLLKTVREHVAQGIEADLYITNFVYDKVFENTRYVSHYRKHMPANRFFGWEEVKPMHTWKMLLMHSLLYKTENLRQSGMILPEHTFYVDNIYAYQPLPHMKKLYYLDVDLYMYYIGRSDQSVTRANMSKRYDQQIRVMNHMLEAYTYAEIKAMGKRLSKEMFHCLIALMHTTILFTTFEDTPERRKMYNDMMTNLKERDRKLYNKIKHHSTVCLLNPFGWKGKGRLSRAGYNFLCRFVKLGV